MADFKRVWSNGKIVRQGKKQVFLKDGEELVTYGNSWEAIDEDQPLETYGNSWEDVSGDDTLEVYGNSEVEIGTVDDFTGGGEDKVTATFKNYDGTVLKTQKVTIGKTPKAPSNPKRPSDSQYSYKFNGWSPELGPIDTDTEYVAQYTATPLPVPPGPEPEPTGDIYIKALRDYAELRATGEDENGQYFVLWYSKLGESRSMNFDFSKEDGVITELRIVTDGEDETITDQTVINNYGIRINSLLEGHGGDVYLNEAQLDYLLDLSIPSVSDTSYPIEKIDGEYGEVYVISKVVNNQTVESINLSRPWTEQGSVLRRTIGESVLDRPETNDATSFFIWNAVNNDYRQYRSVFGETAFNFLKNYNADTMYVYYSVSKGQEGGNTLYTAYSSYLGKNNSYQVDFEGQLTDDGTQIINNRGQETWYVTGDKYTHDIEWLNSLLGQLLQDNGIISQFVELGRVEYRMRNTISDSFGVEQITDSFTALMFDVTQAYEGEDQYYSVSVMVKQTFEGGTTTTTGKLTTEAADAFFAYVSENNLDSWATLTKEQYDDLITILNGGFIANKELDIDLDNMYLSVTGFGTKDFTYTPADEDFSNITVITEFPGVATATLTKLNDGEGRVTVTSVAAGGTNVVITYSGKTYQFYVGVND